MNHKKNKNHQQRRNRHPLQQSQPLTPFRNHNPSDGRYVGSRSPAPYHSQSQQQNQQQQSNTTNYQHFSHKAQYLQQFYEAPTLPEQHQTTTTTTTTTTSTTNQNTMNNSPQTQQSLIQQSTLGQINPALAYTVSNLRHGGLDLRQCKIIDGMYDNDTDQDPMNIVEDLSSLTQQQQQLYHKQQHEQRNIIPEEHISTHDYCHQHHVPAHALFSLSNISCLTSYASAGSIVIFDIDDTLVKRQHYDSSLLTSLGTSMLHAYIQSPACASMSYDFKQNLVNSLGNALRTFVLAEDDTAKVVETLQQRGCYVFALTARSSTMSTTTSQSLSSLGINFKHSLPPSMPIQAIEPQTGAAVIDGIIYCNDTPKGLVFQKFLSQQWISFPILHTCGPTTCQNNPHCDKNGTIVSCTAKQSTHHRDTPCPERPVWFIDDSFTMLQSMLQQWQGQAEKQLEFFSSLQPNLQSQMPCHGKLALVCCHYTHPTNYTLNPAANPAPIDNQQLLEKVIATQISHFVTSNKILSDKEALAILAGTNTQ